MYRIVRKEALKPTVILYEIEAPMVAKKAEPGQFIILRVDENGERIPITIHDYDREKGTVTINVQTVAYPVLKKFHDCGAEVHAVVGFKNKDVVILEDKFKSASDVMKLVTDDGSYGEKGLVTDALKQLIEEGNQYDEIFAIGPAIMMKFVSKTTEPYGIPTTVSMSPIMVDGTGMCGGCRLTVGGETKFACVDGPDFDGHKVDWDESLKRGKMYFDWERHKHEEVCNLFKKEVQ